MFEYNPDVFDYRYRKFRLLEEEEMRRLPGNGGNLPELEQVGSIRDITWEYESLRESFQRSLLDQ